MRVLVTGATGFLGGAVSKRLASEGHAVLATGRDRARGQALTRAGIAFESADLNDAYAVEKLCKQAEIVVHCAALSSPWGPYQAFVRANLEATRTLAEACRNSGVRRLVHISTPSIYAGAGDRENVHEDAPLPPPINHYAATKLAAEHVVRAAHARGLPSILLRPRAIFGPGDTTIFPRLIRALSRGRLPQLGDGRNRVDLSYIDNVVDAVLLAMSADDSALGQAYNICNGEPVLLWQLIGRICDELQLPRPKRRLSTRKAMLLAGGVELAYRVLRREDEPLLTRYGVEVLTCTMTLDLGKARNRLGYSPRVSIDEGVARFLAWWRVQDKESA